MCISTHIRTHYYIILMNTLTQTMDNIYYQALYNQSLINKINISLPISIFDSPSSAIIVNSNIDINNDSISESINTIKYSDEYIYRKPWNKLNIIHKIIKIKEYIDGLNIDDNDIKNNFKGKLISLVKNKQLIKKTDVVYDINLGKIQSISILQYKKNEYIIV